MTAVNSEIAAILATEVAGLTEEIASLLFNEPLEQQAVTDLLDKLRGVCQLLELDGAVLLTEELKRAINFIVSKGSSPLTYQSELSKVLDAYPRLFAVLNQIDLLPPFLFTPKLAVLRRLQGLPPLYEFQMVKGHSWPPAERFAGSTELTPEIQQALKKLRQFYQMGLLEILRGKDQNKGAEMLARVAGKLRQIFTSQAEQRYWTLVAYVVDGFKDGQLHFNPVRVRLLAAVERQLKTLLDGDADIGKAYPLGLWRAYGILLGLMPVKSAAAEALCEWVGTPRFAFTDADLQDYRVLIFGRRDDELNTAVDAMAVKLNNLHNILELIDSREQLSEEEGAELAALVEEIATLCRSSGLHRAAQRFADHHTSMRAGAGDVKHSSLFRNIAHSILYLECLLLALRERTPLHAEYLRKLDLRDLDEVVEERLLHSSVHMVWSECLRSLTTTRDALDQIVNNTANHETQKTLLADLKEIEGAAKIVGDAQVVDIVRRCRRFVGTRLFTLPKSGRESLMAAFADAVAALEYYFHNTSRGDNSQFVLAIANDHLTALEAA